MMLVESKRTAFLAITILKRMSPAAKAAII